MSYTSCKKHCAARCRLLCVEQWVCKGIQISDTQCFRAACIYDESWHGISDKQWMGIVIRETTITVMMIILICS